MWRSNRTTCPPPCVQRTAASGRRTPGATSTGSPMFFVPNRLVSQHQGINETYSHIVVSKMSPVHIHGSNHFMVYPNNRIGCPQAPSVRGRGLNKWKIGVFLKTTFGFPSNFGSISAGSPGQARHPLGCNLPGRDGPAWGQHQRFLRGERGRTREPSQPLRPFVSHGAGISQPRVSGSGIKRLPQQKEREIPPCQNGPEDITSFSKASLPWVGDISRALKSHVARSCVVPVTLPFSGFRAGCQMGHMAVGQNQWYHFGVSASPILVFHWGYGILTHGHVSLVSFPKPSNLAPRELMHACITVAKCIESLASFRTSDEREGCRLRGGVLF